MDKVIGTIIVLSLISLAITGMIFSWRKRVARDARYSVVLPGVAESGHQASPQEFSALYVSTTLATNPLQRIALPGLAFRADAQLLVSKDGVTISPRGEKETFIPAAQMLQIHRSQVTIDRVVEKDGLTALSWTAFDNTLSEPIEFTSYFRISSPEIRLACENALATTFPHATSKEVSS